MINIYQTIVIQSISAHIKSIFNTLSVTHMILFFVLYIQLNNELTLALILLKSDDDVAFTIDNLSTI